MILDIDKTFDALHESDRTVTEQFLEIGQHQIPRDFSRRRPQNLRFIAAQDEVEEDDFAEADELEEEGEIEEIPPSSDDDWPEATAPKDGRFRPKHLCSCQQMPRFLEAGSKGFNITSRQNDELAGCNHYLAVSYCWEKGTKTPAEYSVCTSDNKGTRANEAPTTILTRAIRFAAEHDIRLIWIDQECLEQNDREEKELGIQSMDMVYQEATHTLILLNVRIATQGQMDSLCKALEGAEYTSQEEFEDAVDVMEAIAADRWFTRAWCFQEVAAAGELAWILIGYDQNLKAESSYISIPGEFAVQAQDLRGAATWVERWPHIKAESTSEGGILDVAIRHRAAGCFDRIMRMCPIAYQFFSKDPEFRFGPNASEALHFLGERQNSRIPDRLAILANICNYTKRLNTESLVRSENARGREYSYSICVAVLAIINGDTSLLTVSARHGIEEAGIETEQQSPECSPLIASWMAVGRAKLKDLPVIEEDSGVQIRLQSPRISSEGLVLLGHLWKVDCDCKVEMHDVRSKYLPEWNKYVGSCGDGIGHVRSGALQRRIFWSVLLSCCAKGMHSLANCLWDCVRPETISSPTSEDKLATLEKQHEVLELPVPSNFSDVIDERTGDFCLYLPPLIKSEKDVDHLLGTGNGSVHWIAQQVMERGHLWCGRRLMSSRTTRSGQHHRLSKPQAVFDCCGPRSILTPDYSNIHGRSRLSDLYQVILWSVTDTGQYSHDGSILKSQGLVRGVWQAKSQELSSYVLQ